MLRALPGDVAQAAGWTASELEALLGAGDDEEPIAEDDAPDPLLEAVTAPGDLWQLGEHRLLCGDSTETAAVDRLMGGAKAALVATDPPYLVDYTGVRAGDRGKDWSATYREIDIDDAGTFFHGVFANVVRVMAPGAAIYCWHAHKRICEIVEAWRALGILDHQQIIWVKPIPVFGSVFWHFRHEPCLMGWVQGSKPPHDGRHDQDSVWVTAGTQVPVEQLTRAQAIRLLKECLSTWELDWEGKARPVGYEHPTAKPVEIFARPMRKHTRKGDICYEPFSGSGSQLAAAQLLGRRCMAMELEPIFVDVGVRRWQKLTGEAATLAGDGRTWAEVAQARGVALEAAPAGAGKDGPCHTNPSDPAPRRAARRSRAPATAKRTKRK